MMRKSPWVCLFDGASCNGCSIELLALVTPRYDIERFGCLWKYSARNADILIVTGCSNEITKHRLLTVYKQMAKKKVVVAVGSCALSRGVFAECYNTKQCVKDIVPVDIFVPGCPPRPEATIDALLKALNIIQAGKETAAEKK
ncbi:MAG: NADH-quinone oxidoreductase subunit NuoB [Candidatus Woesearchaeota archaeon]